MKQKTKPAIAIVLGTILLISGSANAQRYMEKLGRGMIAIRTGSSQVYVGWRLLGTDPNDIAFNLYRSTGGGAAVKRNSTPITQSTNYVDNGVNLSYSNSYFVRPVLDGEEGAASTPFTLPAYAPIQQYISVPLVVPAGGTTPDDVDYTYTANDASVGDLDGDGEYEIVLKWDPSNSKDNSQSGYTGKVFLDAYELDGTLMWRVDLGINIRAGAHYTQFMVYDLDSDGKAEVACKTADGTVDGVGVVIGDPYADWRNGDGRILDGPEYLTIFDGQTGAAMATTSFYPDRVNVSQWGDSYGNRVDRFLAAIAYLDGQRPSLIMARGYYGPKYSWGQARNEITAWNWRNGTLTQLWWFKAGYNINDDINIDYIGQGNHNLSVGDVDGDGKDEIVYGSCTIDDDGTGMYSTGYGHGDAMHLSDMDPDHPGLEVFKANGDGPNLHGIDMHAAATGQLLWSVESTASNGVGRAVAMDLDPRYLGYEAWSTGTDGMLHDVQGNVIATLPGNMFYNFGIWWDADLLRELLDRTTISKWRWDWATPGRENLVYAPSGLTHNNGSKATPCLSGDILGDWREEVIWRRSDNTALQIWTTKIVATNRIYTLMHDPQYRLSIAWQNVAYNQPPHTDFYLGYGMAEPPRPDIRVVYGDFTSDGIVNRDDLSEFVEFWLVTDCNNVELDWNGDCIINSYEFSLLSQDWLEGIQ